MKIAIKIALALLDMVGAVLAGACLLAAIVAALFGHVAITIVALFLCAVIYFASVEATKRR